ncbi:MAG: PilZ domain-containing protein [Candidatus Xenobia bacterium]
MIPAVHLEERGVEPMYADRRHAPRRLPGLGDVVPAVVLEPSGVQARCYVFLLDVGKGGMRIAAHYCLPNGVLQLALLTDRLHYFRVTVRWRRSLDNFWIMGLQFVDPAAAPQIEQFIQQVAASEQRRSLRVPSQIWVDMAWDDQQTRLSGTALDLSSGGLRMLTNFTPPDVNRLTVTLHLNDGEEPPRIESEVAWLRQKQDFLVGVKFLQVPPGLQARLQRYVERAVVRLMHERLSTSDPWTDPRFQAFG